ncbi:MAG: hypothetical protein V7K94_07365, partial [Nostoc sp.]|uniref:hypothetical protein n=1 Tax=Nostoc sp. TaxID=1180 RepID=UPI002FF7A7A3
ETTVHTVLNLTPMTLIKLLLHTCKFSRRLTYFLLFSQITSGLFCQYINPNTISLIGSILKILAQAQPTFSASV